jgi:CBS domain containing-hemolysin-like protein
MIDTILFLMLFSATALCSAAETAFFSLSVSELRLMERRNETHAKMIVRLRSLPKRLLITILFLNTAGNITIAAYATMVAIRHFGSFGAGLATGIVTIASLILTEVFPKSFAITHRRQVAKFIAPALNILVPALYPLTFFLLKLDHFVMEHFGGSKKHIVSEEEVRVVAELGLEHGSIDKREQEMIERIFKFDDIPVSAVMARAADIAALDGAATIKEIAHYIAAVGYSRFPIYEGKTQNYIGYVYANKVLRALNSDDRDLQLHTIAVPLSRVDANMKLEQAFLLMVHERSHLFLVHEHNDPTKIVGLVTLEDMLEEIVGEIEDEGDGGEVGSAHA